MLYEQVRIRRDCFAAVNHQPLPGYGHGTRRPTSRHFARWSRRPVLEDAFTPPRHPTEQEKRQKPCPAPVPASRQPLSRPYRQWAIRQPDGLSFRPAIRGSQRAKPPLWLRVELQAGGHSRLGLLPSNHGGSGKRRDFRVGMAKVCGHRHVRNRNPPHRTRIRQQPCRPLRPLGGRR